MYVYQICIIITCNIKAIFLSKIFILHLIYELMPLIINLRVLLRGKC